MATSREIEAGRAFVRISLQDNVTNDLKKIGDKLFNFGATIAKIGASIGGLGTVIKGSLDAALLLFAKAGSEIYDAMRQTGLSAKYIQELKYAAEQSGGSLEDVTKIARGLSKQITALAEGNKEAIENFAGLGLAFKDLKDLSPDERLQKVIDKLYAIKDPAERAGVAMQAVGGGGHGGAVAVRLLEMMEMLASRKQHLQNLGSMIPESDVMLAKEFSLALNDVWGQVNRIIDSVGAAVAEALMPYVDIVERILKTSIEWIDSHRKLIPLISGIATALIVAGAAITAVGVGIIVVGQIMTGIAAVFGTLAGLIAFCLQPAVALTAVVLGLAGYLAYASGVATQVFTYLRSLFTDLKAVALEAFGGIADALAAGDIVLAGQIAWTALRLAWAEGTQAIRELWYVFVGDVIKLGSNAWYGLLKIWETVSAGLQKGFAVASNFFIDTWQAAIATVTDWFVEFERRRMKSQVDSDQQSGKLTKQQADDQKRFIDQQFDHQNDLRHKNDQAEQASRDQASSSKLAQIESEKQKTIAQLNATNDAIAKDADKHSAQQINDLQKQKQDLQKQLDDLRKKAGEEKKNNGGPIAPNIIKPDKQTDWDDLLDQRAAATSMKSQGTFNAAAIQAGGMAGSSVHEKVAKNTERTAKATEKMAKNKATFASR